MTNRRKTDGKRKDSKTSRGSFSGSSDSDSRSVGLSRGEAESVIDALSASETSEPAGEETTQEIEERFESTFDLGENGGEGESD